MYNEKPDTIIGTFKQNDEKIVWKQEKLIQQTLKVKNELRLNYALQTLYRSLSSLIRCRAKWQHSFFLYAHSIQRSINQSKPIIKRSKFTKHKQQTQKFNNGCKTLWQFRWKLIFIEWARFLATLLVYIAQLHHHWISDFSVIDGVKALSRVNCTHEWRNRFICVTRLYHVMNEW